MNPQHDLDNAELRRVLTELLDEGVAISAREVARRHQTLKNVSAFSRGRNEARASLIDEWRERQRKGRDRFSARPGDETSKRSVGKQLEEVKAENKVLKAQVKALSTSHAACVRAVYLHGGTRALLEFWKKYQNIEATLRNVDAMPEVDNIHPIPGSRPAQPRKGK